MLLRRHNIRTTALALTLMMAAIAASPASAHCDSMSGPVVKDAQIALAGKKVDPVLKWVGRNDEAEIRDAFNMTLAVRNESTTARRVADRYFFETVVRVHRATEGEGFTGLKPAGHVDPVIAAADRALANGSGDQFANATATAVREGMQRRFTDALNKRKLAEQSLAQGREYVQAYVEFTHFAVSADHLAAEGPSHKHLETSANAQ